MSNFLRAVVAAVGLMALAALPVRAGGPVVCLAGADNINILSFDLATCDAPTGEPVVVEVELAGGSAPYAYLEGDTSYCDVSDVASCAVTVSDGVLDGVYVENANYQVVASWVSPQNSYTYTLQSGNVLTIERSYTYGERTIGWLLVFVAALMLLLVTMMAVLIRRN